VIRIASFREQDYPEACARAFKPGMGARALQLATRAELQKELRRSIDYLRRNGARRMLIDLTGNGGGSEWDVEAAALFTPRTLVRQAPREAKARCDRGLVWKGAKPPCPVFADAPTTVTTRGKGVWGGPVVILADRNTASAAEEFIGWLVDNRVARLAGETTMGAGCGYVDGGAPVVLSALPMTLQMPNCARFTAKDTNEMEGFTPSIEGGMPKDGEEPSWGLALSQALGA
jgi:C-terminal processing protease CtpA/Prc